MSNAMSKRNNNFKPNKYFYSTHIFTNSFLKTENKIQEHQICICGCGILHHFLKTLNEKYA